MQINSSEPPRQFKQALHLFNQGKFFEAHEYFEAAWRETNDETREFYRALLQLSGGYYRLTQDRPTAARKFFTHALHWLQGFPDPHLGINTDLIQQNLREMIKAIDSGSESDQVLKQLSRPIQSENHPRS